MKKNFTINMRGRLFAIDEDAYEMLSTYERSLRHYFRNREGGNEIADDLEERIAELLDDVVKTGSEAISIEHVQDIINRLGNPQQMDDGEPQADEVIATTQAAQSAKAVHEAMNQDGTSARRLYRDYQNKKWMGVLAGLSAFFGGDVLLWRLCYVATFVLSFFTYKVWELYFIGNILMNISLLIFIAYFVMAIIMPVATTPEERLRMKGRVVNPANIANEVSQNKNKIKTAQREDHLGCVGGFFYIFVYVLKLLVGCVAGCVAISMFGVVVALLVALITPDQLTENLNWDVLDFLLPLHGNSVIFAIAIIIALSISIFAIVHIILRALKIVQPTNLTTRIVLIIIWIASILTAAVMSIGIAKKIFDYAQAKDAEWLEQHTHNGIFINDKDWDVLQKFGWIMLAGDDCLGGFTATGEHWTGDRNRPYLSTYDDLHRQRYTACRTEVLQPGTYRLWACGRASGDGAALFLTDSLKNETLLCPIPVYHNRGGEIWQKACNKRDSLLKADCKVPREVLDLINVNNKNGWGWSELNIGPFTITEPTKVSFGFSTDPAITKQTWLGEWFTGSDVKIERCDNK